MRDKFLIRGPQLSANSIRRVVPFAAAPPQLGWVIFVLAAVVTGLLKTDFLWTWTNRVSLGGDFASNIWGPAHGLLHGFNPFIPDHVYQTQYQTTTGAMYTPDVYLLAAPASFAPFRAGAIVFFSAMVIITWCVVLVLIRPWTTSRMIAGAVLGAVVLYSLPSEYSLLLGQPTALLGLGVALTIRAVVKEQMGWLAVVGVSLALLKVQTGLPIVLVLLALGAFWVVVRAIALTLLLSLPALIAEVGVAHGIAGLFRTWRTNLDFLNSVNATSTLANRVDLAGTVFRLGVVNINVVQLVSAVALSAVAVFVVRRVRPGLWMWPFVASYLLLVLYHQQYDVLLVLLCFVPVLLAPRYDLKVRLLCLSLLLVEFACRSGFIISRISPTKLQQFYSDTSSLTTFVVLAIFILAAARALADERHGITAARRSPTMSSLSARALVERSRRFAQRGAR
jgi:hypothetical protein